MSKVVDSHEAVQDIRDGMSVASVGVIGWLTPDALFGALADRFAATGQPRDLTLFLPVATGDSMDIAGMDRVAQRGLLKRIISGSYVNPVHPRTGQRPALSGLIQADAVEAYSWPIGATMHWLREVARRGPGYLTKVGLGTYIDPRLNGGRLTASARDDLVKVVTFNGEEWLFYPSWPLDVAFLRATTADERGNLSFEREALTSASLAMAMAVKASGGQVLVQVERMAPMRTRAAREIVVPGSLVDRVIVTGDVLMTTDTPHNPRYLETPAGETFAVPPMPMSVDKIIARRASREMQLGVPTIFGFGASSAIPQVMAEDGQLTPDTLDDYIFTTEHGSFGGIVMGGWQFSANLLPTALIDGPSQFDLIDSGHCRMAALAFAEFDSTGAVNVSRFGSANPGAGGYIDIAQNAHTVLLTGTFTTGGLETTISDGELRIVREGKTRKFVAHVRDVTYRARDGVRDRQQEITLITERAVFRVAPDGLELMEIAPGVDLQRDVLDQMEFAPVRICDPLLQMDAALFKDVAQSREP